MQAVALVLFCLVSAANAGRVQRRTEVQSSRYKSNQRKADEIASSSHSLAEVRHPQTSDEFKPMKALAMILMASNAAATSSESERTDLTWQIKNTPFIFINLESRPDRRKRMEEQLAKYGLEGTRYAALTGLMVSDTVIGDTWQPGMHASFDIRQVADSWHTFSDGERGCAGSHVTLWQLCVKENLPIIILEDDAAFGDDFLVKLQQSMRHIADHDPTLLYFQATVGEWGSYRKVLTPDLEIRSVKYASDAAAYAIWPQTASILLSNLPMSEPLDSYLSRLAYDGKIRTYACSPEIIHQFDQLGDSDVPRTGLMSDDEFREKMRKQMKLDKEPEKPEGMRENSEKPAEPEATGESEDNKDLSPPMIYINMANRPDRRQRVEDQLVRHGLTAERFEAVTGEGTPDAVIDRTWQPGLNAKFDIRQSEDEWHTLSDGERGCAGSHAVLWERCVRENRPIVIIEDDAVFASDFPIKLEQAIKFVAEHDPSFLYLQSNVAEWGSYSKAIAPGLQIRGVNYVWETGGYVIWPKVAAILLEKLPMHQPVDDYLAKMAYTGVIHQYACYPAIIRQYDQMGDSDIAHTGVMSQEAFREKMLYLMKNRLPPFN